MNCEAPFIYVAYYLARRARAIDTQMEATEKSSAESGTPDLKEMVSLYERLLLVRRCEERLMNLFASGEVPGFIHLSIGQEAVSVGVMNALRAQDTIASTHRGHGHAIAKGVALDTFFSELLAKDSGICRGRGGSMHIADMSVGMLGANGIVGAGVPIATGSALAHRAQSKGNVAVAFFGDGALAEGVVHESVNVARLWKLPILFVCEANGWSEFSPASSQIAFNLKSWAAAFDLPFVQVDGNDVVAVAQVAARLIDSLRAGGPPALLECVTKRVRGHYEGDAQKYRPRNEVVGNDPIAVGKKYLERLGLAGSKIAAVEARVEEQIERAIATARAGAPANFQLALQHVYTETH
jgi:TPP-dependent pyruvate/acetoin dehydrogenase alpha subunit